MISHRQADYEDFMETQKPKDHYLIFRIVQGSSLHTLYDPSIFDTDRNLPIDGQTHGPVDPDEKMADFGLAQEFPNLGEWMKTFATNNNCEIPSFFKPSPITTALDLNTVVSNLRAGIEAVYNSRNVSTHASPGIKDSYDVHVPVSIK